MHFLGFEIIYEEKEFYKFQVKNRQGRKVVVKEVNVLPKVDIFKSDGCGHPQGWGIWGCQEYTCTRKSLGIKENFHLGFSLSQGFLAMCTL